jgi:hypothetical protein
MIVENQQDLAEQRLSVDVKDPILQKALLERRVSECKRIMGVEQKREYNLQRSNEMQN